MQNPGATAPDAGADSAGFRGSRPAAVIELAGVAKSYRIYRSPYHRLLERMPWSGRPRHRTVDALTDVDLSIPRGTCVGLIGANGSGKTTLLRIVAGTLSPTAGVVAVRGRAVNLVDLTTAFHPMFTGRQNVAMHLATMGLTRRQINAQCAAVADFAELDDFIDAPVRVYSTGMIARLGFSTTLALDPDVLLLDEILAVGDAHFRRKCTAHVLDLRRRGKSLLLSSHMLYDVQQLCDLAVWLRAGRVQAFDDAVRVTNDYFTYELRSETAAAVTPWPIDTDAPVRVTDAGGPRIVDIRLTDAAAGTARCVHDFGADIGVRVTVDNPGGRRDLDVLVGVIRADGVLCFVCSSREAGIASSFRRGTVTLVLPGSRLLPGAFIARAWLLGPGGRRCFDDRRCPDELIVRHRRIELGLFDHQRRWQVEALVPGR